MQQLITQLIQGTRTYTEDNVATNHPPTALSLRAARTIAHLANINISNNDIISKLQQREIEAQTVIERLQIQVETLQNQLVEKEQNESLRISEQQASDVGSGDDQLSGSNSGSEGVDSDQDRSTSQN